MTPKQRQEMRALVASLGPGRVWVLLLDKDGALVPLKELPRSAREGEAAPPPGGRLRIDGLEVEVTTLETAHDQTALAYVVQAADARQP